MPYTDFSSKSQDPRAVLSIAPKLLHVGYEYNDPDWYNLEHSHNACEIIYMTEGKESAVIGGQRYEISAGELIVINAGAVHQEWANSEVSRKCIVLTFDGFQREGLPPNHLIDRHSSPIVKPLADKDFLAASFRMLLQEANKDSLYGYTMSQLLLRQIVILALRNADKPEKPSQHYHTECALVKEFIDEHYRERISLEDLAAYVFVSKGHLSHVFRQQTGEAPIRYLIRKRIDEAKKLLIQTDLPIQQVAEGVGYDSSVYFCQLFCKETGLAPTQYRRKYRIQK